MNKDQREYVLGQLDKMAEELESVSDVAKRAELRGMYIELFIDLCTVSNMSGAVHEEQLVDDEPVEDAIEEEVFEEADEVVEEPESVTAETEAVVEEPTEEEESKVYDSEDIFEDAEEVRVVLNDDEEEVDITEIYNKLVAEGLDSDSADSIGLFLTEQQAMKAYNEDYAYMAHGFPRAYAAYLGTAYTNDQLLAYILDFSGLDIGALKSPTEFIDDENAEAIFDFINQ